MLKSNSQLMAQTFDLGAIDQVNEQLSLLAQFKDSYIRVQDRVIGGEERTILIRPRMTCCLSCHFLKKCQLDSNSDIVSTSSTGGGHTSNMHT